MQSPTSFPDTELARELINAHIDQASPDLHEQVNKVLHANPETCYKEFIAHETLTAFLEKRGFEVKRSTYGLETSFEAALGEGGRQVVFCAEYDALPNIGHGCGHNLIATSSMAAFMGAAHAMKTLGLPGRLRILGTPAEEGGGGKEKLIEAGAFDPPEDIAAAIMAHPMSKTMVGPQNSDIVGLAGLKCSATIQHRVEYRGTTAHAAAEPWNGINALDAAVSAYNNAALLRQQIRPDERIHAIIEEGGTVQNIITSYSRMSWNVRSATLSRAEKLWERVKKCIESGAAATGCTVEYIPASKAPNLRVNDTLCEVYAADMVKLGRNVIATIDETTGGSTDMGNVSHYVPSFHGTFAIPAPSDVVIHNPKFTAAAATDEAHAEAIACAKGMAMLAVRVLAEDAVAAGARRDFEKPDDL